MAIPILYSFRRCPYAMRARLGLWVSGCCVELREVKLSNKPDALLEASPKATVPVMVLADGRVVDESEDIMRWALAQGDPEGWLERDDGELIARNDGPFKRDLDRYKYPERHDSDALLHREAGMAFLAELDGRLADGGQLSGAKRGMADMAIMPFVRQFANVDRDWFDGLELPHLQKWLAAHLASDLFEAIMIRPAPWKEGDTPLLFGKEAKGAPPNIQA